MCRWSSRIVVLILEGCLALHLVGMTPSILHAAELDEESVQRGQSLFNGKAVCFGCHGRDGDLTQVDNPLVAKLNPGPANLREPSDKSVRQLYFIIKYGIPNTSMVPVQDQASVQEDELLYILSYVLALQGTPLSQDKLFDQLRRRDGEADRAILAICEAKTIGDSDAMAACEHLYAKRYRDLLVGRPADIPPARYAEIQGSCKKRFGTDLDGLARCYRLEYGMTRRTK